ncbi:hypothetical protein BUALT_Bualt19G0103200 [Buddleja alternifolia]|uniref:BHLH domain-containing protein n=1 Tax=Buddleja alternifolia TaxID=168488 RepID=A0AAV6W0T9_9LAMI|nr:hypothetical protein BUALT_Bualt19G0103200 [Buddleja alternifolia]
MEAISEGEWNSFNGMCSEEADFMAQLLGNCSLPNEVQNGSNYTVFSNFWPSHEPNVNVSGVDESEMYSISRGGSGFLFPSSSHESYYNPSASQHVFVGNNNLMTMDYGLMESKNNVMEGDDFLNQDVSNDSIVSDEKLSEDVLHGKDLQLGREHETPVPEEKIGSPTEISKKRPRIPGEFQRGRRSMKLKKCLKIDDNDEDDDNNNNSNAAVRGQNSSGCCSEDDSNGSHEVNGVTSSSSSKGSGALNLSGRTRASRGSATDPQSLYARKRRERINERLKILQNLVPNGTKVDISTMLEEAVQYVKFLQLQIKLLSSDDMWMYAPLAYNGMDLGLDLKIATHRSQS